MHNVHAPAASPDSPGTERLVKLNVPLPFGNVLTGNAATVVPLCASVPRRIERKSWRPEMSSLAAVESPVVATLRLVHAVPLSIVARFGLAEPDQAPPPPPPQVPVNVSENEL